MTSPRVIPLSGWYRQSHAALGLRLQLVPFAGLFLLVAVAAVAMYPMSRLISLELALVDVALAFFVIRSYRQRLQQARLTFKSQHSHGQLEPEGLRLTADGEESVRPWSHFSKVQVFPKLILLHTPANEVTMLPREFFAEADWAPAVRLVRSSIASQPTVPRSLKIACWCGARREPTP